MQLPEHRALHFTSEVRCTMPGKGNTVPTALKVQIVDLGFSMFLLPAAGLRNS
jgi:hypothetical protein